MGFISENVESWNYSIFIKENSILKVRIFSIVTNSFKIKH